MSQPVKTLSLLLALGLAAQCFTTIGCEASGRNRGYEFIVAGHAYGSHNGANLGLYPKFLAHLRDLDKERPDFLVLTGDIVRHPDQQSWDTALDELDALRLPYYMIRGNHDVSKEGLAVFKKKYGGTFYCLDRGTEKLVFLDTQKEWGRITPDQIELLKKELADLTATKNIFIFMHELIWTAHMRPYRKVHHNFGSYNRKFRSNFWGDLYPLLEPLNDKNIFIVAGDVGGNPGVLPAFYEQKGHITLIASGMGEVRDENYLRVQVKDGEVRLSLVPLNADNQLRPLTEYSLPNL